MPARVRAVALGLAALAAGLAALAGASATASAASAAGDTGGLVYVLKPKIQRVECRSHCGDARSSRVAVPARPGSLLRVRGRNLRNVDEVTFLGGRGTHDDVHTSARQVRDSRLQVRVPDAASSGPIRLVDRDGVRSNTSRATLLIPSGPSEDALDGDASGDVTPPLATRPFIWPVNGMLTSPFGPRWGRLHAGIDIALPSGKPIRAAADGVVTFRGWSGGYGNLTCIAHRFAAPVQGMESWTTCYAHQSAYETRLGAVVRQGEVIGRVGCTGSCSGDHLHFEIREGEEDWGTPHNPIPFLPVRATKSSALAPPLDLLPNHGV